MATRGKQALDLALEYVPAAITLDIFLPDMLGWTVLNNLKLNPKTRHIPVQIISLEEERQHGLAHGAFSYMVKPVTTEGLESLLRPDPELHHAASQAVAGGRGQRAGKRSITELLLHDDIEIVNVGTGAGAPRRSAANRSTVAYLICACRT